jgi:hypothetical protein
MSAASTRRSALGFTAAAIVAGLTTPALASAPVANADAELIAACEDAFRCEAMRVRMNQDPTDDEDETDRANDAWFAAFERVTTLRARAPAGIRAKVAELLVAVLEHVVMGPEYTLEDNGLWHEKLAISLCDDG